MNHGAKSFYLLTSQDKSQALAHAVDLDKINRQRQAQLDKTIKQAKEKILKGKLHQKKIILVFDETWAAGIVGLVAGKLVEQFGRPAIVLQKGDKICSGSARSVEQFHLVEALLSHGGHARAAGLSLENQHLQNLYDQLLELAEAKLKDEDLVPEITVDAVITQSQINFQFYKELLKLEPFGFGNPKPVFMMKNVNLKNIYPVGQNGKHLKMTIADFGAIGFDLGPKAENFQIGDKIDAVFNLDENTYNDTTNLQLKILDLKKSI
jgi:single-stranded-DNA-specific exonuclease